MIRFSKIAILAIAATALGSPAFAQSFDPEAGTGNVFPFSYSPAAIEKSNAAAHQRGHSRIAAPRNGFHSFAMVPGGPRPSGADSNDPALTGGGSTGYNQMLLRD
jgi:hypothetical protein